MTFYCSIETCSASIDLPEALTRSQVDIALSDFGWMYIRNYLTGWVLLCPRCFRDRPHD